MPGEGEPDVLPHRLPARVRRKDAELPARTDERAAFLRGERARREREPRPALIRLEAPPERSARTRTGDGEEQPARRQRDLPARACARREPREPRGGGGDRSGAERIAHERDEARESVAHALSRDDRGVYYYVDVLRKEYGGKGYRVLIGKKGALKSKPLTDIATDTAGDVFATKTGDLRIVNNVEKGGTSVAWVKGGKREQLLSLDPDMNSLLIFHDLGVYGFIGTICESN